METTQVSIGGGVERESVVYPYDGKISSLKNKEILTSATAQVNLEGTVLSLISQSQKDTKTHPQGWLSCE